MTKNEKFTNELQKDHDNKLQEILNNLDKLFFKDDFYDHEK